MVNATHIDVKIDGKRNNAGYDRRLRRADESHKLSGDMLVIAEGMNTEGETAPRSPVTMLFGITAVSTVAVIAVMGTAWAATR